MRAGPPGGVTTVAAELSARGSVDDVVVRAATAAQVGLVRVSADGGVWWSDETYRLHGRPRWRRVRLLDDVADGVAPALAVSLLETYAATLTDPDVDLRYSVTGANGEQRDLVLRAIGLGVAVVHRAGVDRRDDAPADAAVPTSYAADVVDVRDRRRQPDAPTDDLAYDDSNSDHDSDTDHDTDGDAPAPVEAREPVETAARASADADTSAEADDDGDSDSDSDSDSEVDNGASVDVTDVGQADTVPYDLTDVSAEATEPDDTVDVTDTGQAGTDTDDAIDLDLAAAVLSATPDLVLLYDVVAHEFLGMAGQDDTTRELAERIGQGGRLSDDVHPDDRATLAAWRDGLQDLDVGGVRHIDVRFRHDDEWRWSEIRASDFRRDADGRPVAVVLIVRDVHARVSAARRIAESERAFRELFAASPVGLAVLDQQGRFTDVNDAFCLLVGRTRDAVLATVYEALLHPQDRAAAVIPRSRRVHEGATASASERRLTRADGSTIWVRTRTSDLDYAGEQRTLVSLEDVTSAKNTETQLRHDALHDELTGLPNRRLITDRLELALTRARRGGGRVALFFIDLDDLKRVNDTHPWQHRAGDVLLETVAGRVRDTLREADTLGRLGGDEFVAVCEDVGDDDALRDIGERILNAVCTPLTIGTETIAVGVSIGVAVADEDDETAENLLRRADAAMYIAKAAGGSRVARADVGQLDVPAHLDVVGALARRELRLHYQPVVSLGSGAVLGVAGAVRWDHPDRGLIPAHEMRSALGAGAATLPVAHWCIDRAITDVRTVAPTRADNVSVWLSLPGRAALAASTRDAIVESIAGPDGSATADSAPSLVLDVHEADVASLTRRQALHRHLDDLLDVGPLALGVEHFTADLVPVGMLQLLSAASVSLDPDLLTSVGENRSTEELVRALVAAASALGVITIAMHVDSHEQLAIARSLGIHAAYGDLLGPAAPLDSYADLLHDGRLVLPWAEVDVDYDDDLDSGDGTEEAAATDLSLAPVTDEGPTDADIWAGVLGTTGVDRAAADPVAPVESQPQVSPATTTPVELPPSPHLFPTVERTETPAPAPVEDVAPPELTIDLRDLVVHAPAPVAEPLLEYDAAPAVLDHPQPSEPAPPATATATPTPTPTATAPAPATGWIGDALAREYGMDLPPEPRPLIGDVVAHELGVDLGAVAEPPTGSIAERVAYDLGLRLPTVTPSVAAPEPGDRRWETELDRDY